MLRCLKLANGIALAMGLCCSAWAAQAEYPYPTPTQPCPTIPKTSKAPPFGGYYQTKWRQWPGEERLEVVNPRAVNREVVPTPQGQKGVATPPTAPREMPQESPLVPQEGELLPPSGEILPPEKPVTPKPAVKTQGKATHKKEIDLPSGAGLPGLPVEPFKPKKSDTELPKGENKQKAPAIEQPKSSSQLDGPRSYPTASVPFERPVAQQEYEPVMLVNDQQEIEQPLAPMASHVQTAAAVQADSGTQAADRAAYAMTESARPNETSMPQLAMGGYCPVELLRNGQWVTGDLRFTVVHNGAIYRLAGPKQWKEFSTNPETFVPACSGNDAVLAVEEGRTVPGQITYCATFDGRLYMFSCAATQTKFNKAPQRYAVGK
jgi:YHS domain-containing protein